MADAGIPTFHYGNVLVTLMHEVLTHAEKSLTETGHIDAVRPHPPSCSSSTNPRASPTPPDRQSGSIGRGLNNG